MDGFVGVNSEGMFAQLPIACFHFFKRVLMDELIAIVPHAVYYIDYEMGKRVFRFDSSVWREEILVSLCFLMFFIVFHEKSFI